MELVELVRTDAYIHGSSDMQPQRMVETVAKIQAIADSLEWIKVSDRLPEEGEEYLVLILEDYYERHQVSIFEYGIFQHIDSGEVVKWKYINPPKQEPAQEKG